MLRRSMISLSLATVLVLAACGSEDESAPTSDTDTGATESAPVETGAESEPSEDMTVDAAQYECTDPFAANITEIPAEDLITCTTLALAATDGYVTTSWVDGVESKLRVNTDPFTIEVTYPDGEVVVANATDAWVDLGAGEWIAADSTSPEYMIAQASQVFPSYRNSHNPAVTTSQIPDGTVYTVTGTEEIDGVEYYVVTLATEQGGNVSDITMWLTADYRQYRTVMTSGVEGTDPITVETRISEWDVAQDIPLPN